MPIVRTLSVWCHVTWYVLRTYRQYGYMYPFKTHIYVFTCMIFILNIPSVSMFNRIHSSYVQGFFLYIGFFLGCFGGVIWTNQNFSPNAIIKEVHPMHSHGVIRRNPNNMTNMAPEQGLWGPSPYGVATFRELSVLPKKSCILAYIHECVCLRWPHVWPHEFNVKISKIIFYFRSYNVSTWIIIYKNFNGFNVIFLGPSIWK